LRRAAFSSAAATAVAPPSPRVDTGSTGIGSTGAQTAHALGFHRLSTANPHRCWRARRWCPPTLLPRGFPAA